MILNLSFFFPLRGKPCLGNTNAIAMLEPSRPVPLALVLQCYAPANVVNIPQRNVSLLRRRREGWNVHNWSAKTTLPRSYVVEVVRRVHSLPFSAFFLHSLNFKSKRTQSSKVIGNILGIVGEYRTQLPFPSHIQTGANYRLNSSILLTLFRFFFLDGISWWRKGAKTKIYIS